MLKKSKKEKLNLRRINSTLSLGGGGTGENDCLPYETYLKLCESGALKSAVYVCGYGWMLPEVIVPGDGSGSGSGSGSGDGSGSGSGDGSGDGSGTDFGSGSGTDFGSGSGSGSGSGFNGKKWTYGLDYGSGTGSSPGPSHDYFTVSDIENLEYIANVIKQEQYGNEQKWNMISDSCLSILDSMGINIYGVSVTFSPNKAYKAGCSPEKRQVYIGDSFFVSDISAIDAVSIVAHEFIHINEDVKRYSYESQRVHIPFYKMIPQEIETYIKEVVLREPNISENEYQNFCTIEHLQEPEKYRNEVNAYEREVQLFSDVSPKYYKERRYAIWYYSLLEYFANEYYKR